MIRGTWVPPNLKKADNRDQAAETVYFLMRHMGWGYREVMDLPIPAAMEILKFADKELKEQKKSWQTQR